MSHVLNEAQKLLKEYGTANPRELADYLDITIIECSLLKLKGIYFTIEDSKFAVVNSDLELEEQKFVLLHEIAHAHLHPKFNHFAINENKLIVSGKYELQANIFAAVLYMKETPEECKATVGKHLLQKLPDFFFKRL